MVEGEKTNQKQCKLINVLGMNMIGRELWTDDYMVSQGINGCVGMNKIMDDQGMNGCIDSGNECWIMDAQGTTKCSGNGWMHACGIN